MTSRDPPKNQGRDPIMLEAPIKLFHFHHWPKQLTLLLAIEMHWTDSAFVSVSCLRYFRISPWMSFNVCRPENRFTGFNQWRHGRGKSAIAPIPEILGCRKIVRQFFSYGKIVVGLI